MGLNQNQNGEKIKTSTDEERERQIRINRNLARFLADQTAQQRVSKRRQHQNNNVSIPWNLYYKCRQFIIK